MHAGDIGDPGVLEALSALAPVIAVRGNNDRGAWAERLRRRERVQLGEVALYAVHDIADLDIDPRAEGVRVVVRAIRTSRRSSERDGVLYVNPGSAGPRRFKLPIALGELAIEGREVTARIVELDADPGGRAQNVLGSSRHRFGTVYDANLSCRPLLASFLASARGDSVKAAATTRSCARGANDVSHVEPEARFLVDEGAQRRGSTAPLPERRWARSTTCLEEDPQEEHGQERAAESGAPGEAV